MQQNFTVCFFHGKFNNIGDEEVAYIAMTKWKIEERVKEYERDISLNKLQQYTE